MRTYCRLRSQTHWLVSSSSFLGKWIPIDGIDGKLYHFSQERITFAKAKATCEHNKGKLFEPTTEGINNIIAAIAKVKHQIVNPWIGIHHLHDEGRTVFASDKTTVAWSNWDDNEPNNWNDGEDCVHLYYNEYAVQYCSYKNIGDNCCDWHNNYEGCFWDGGDCCGDNINCCSPLCECLEPDGFELKPCNYEQIADGICNDDTNTEDCKWDGGDCCGDVDMSKCSVCECLEPCRWNDNNCTEYRRFICEKDSSTG